MNSYKALNNQIFENGECRLLPIRFQDRYKIMNWRNEQIYHLRQNKPLTKEDQDIYFEQVVAKLFDLERPDQLLFSYLENNICIGYGGLVHINWLDRNAEISFIMETRLEKHHFERHWSIYLALIEEVAFNQLCFHKLITYAFDLRPHLYEILEKNAYKLEATLIDHVIFNENFIDVIIHSKIKNNDRY